MCADWQVQDQCGSRHSRPMPRTGAGARAVTGNQLTRLARIWLASRGVWDALPGAGPAVPIPAARAHVTRYIEAYAELLAELR
jgi:hypothetical protein